MSLTFKTPPPYEWVPGTPDRKYGSPNGCNGCDFRPLAAQVRCSDIPCQRHPGMVARIVKDTK